MFITDIIVTAVRQGGLSNAPSNSIEAMLELRRAQEDT